MTPALFGSNSSVVDPTAPKDDSRDDDDDSTDGIPSTSPTSPLRHLELGAEPRNCYSTALPARFRRFSLLVSDARADVSVSVTLYALRTSWSYENVSLAQLPMEKQQAQSMNADAEVGSEWPMRTPGLERANGRSPAIQTKRTNMRAPRCLTQGSDSSCWLAVIFFHSFLFFSICCRAYTATRRRHPRSASRPPPSSEAELHRQQARPCCCSLCRHRCGGRVRQL